MYLKVENTIGAFKGIKIGNYFYLSHLLFLDDILIFNDESRRDVDKLKEILDIYYTTTRMLINVRKSSVSFTGIPLEDQVYFSHLFLHSQLELEGKKYCP